MDDHTCHPKEEQQPREPKLLFLLALLPTLITQANPAQPRKPKTPYAVQLRTQFVAFGKDFDLVKDEWKTRAVERGTYYEFTEWIVDYLPK